MKIQGEIYQKMKDEIESFMNAVNILKKKSDYSKEPKMIWSILSNTSILHWIYDIDITLQDSHIETVTKKILKEWAKS